MIKHYRFLFVTLLVSMSCFSQSKKAATPSLYYPALHSWEKRSPESVGLSASAIQEAIRITKQGTSPNQRSQRKTD